MRSQVTSNAKTVALLMKLLVAKLTTNCADEQGGRLTVKQMNWLRSVASSEGRWHYGSEGAKLRETWTEGDLFYEANVYTFPNGAGTYRLSITSITAWNDSKAAERELAEYRKFMFGDDRELAQRGDLEGLLAAINNSPSARFEDWRKAFKGC